MPVDAAREQDYGVGRVQDKGCFVGDGVLALGRDCDLVDEDELVRFGDRGLLYLFLDVCRRLRVEAGVEEVEMTVYDADSLICCDSLG